MLILLVNKQTKIQKRGGNVSIKEKREKEKGSQEKRKEKIMKKKLKRNGSIGGSSSSELENSVGFLGKIKNGVGCADVSEDREGLGMVGNKGGIGLK